MSILTDPFRRSTALAGVLVVAGFAGIGLTWSGVAATLSVPEQVAFALSGGFGGVALAGTGLALLDVQRRRLEAARERRDLARFARELAEVSELIARRWAGTPGRSAPSSKRSVRRPS